MNNPIKDSKWKPVIEKLKNKLFEEYIEFKEFDYESSLHLPEMYEGVEKDNLEGIILSPKKSKDLLVKKLRDILRNENVEVKEVLVNTKFKFKVDFSKLIKQFIDTYQTEFIKLLDYIQISPDEHLYKIKTKNSIYYVFETDYVGDFKQDVKEVVEKEISEKVTFLKVKKRIEDIEDSQQYKHAKYYKKPEGWSEIADYANGKFGSKPYYFSFLLRQV